MSKRMEDSLDSIFEGMTPPALPVEEEKKENRVSLWSLHPVVFGLNVYFNWVDDMRKKN